MSESLLAQAPIGIAVLGTNGYFFATYARLNEYIVTGRHRTIFDITPRHLHARLRQQLTTVKRTGKPLSIQIPLMGKDGSINWMQLTVENSNTYKLIAYFTPIDQYMSLQEVVLMLGNDPINLEGTVNEIGGLMNCDVVCIVQKDGEVVAFWKDGEIEHDATFEMASSPCATVLRKKDIVYIPMHVQKLYAASIALKKMRMQGYFGIPIKSGDKVAGVLSIMSRDALIIDDLHVAILRLFSMRAAGVLRYNREDSQFRHELETHG